MLASRGTLLSTAPIRSLLCWPLKSLCHPRVSVVVVVVVVGLLFFVAQLADLLCGPQIFLTLKSGQAPRTIFGFGLFFWTLDSLTFIMYLHTLQWCGLHALCATINKY